MTFSALHIRQTLGVTNFSLSRITALPDESPEYLAVKVEWDGASHVLHLYRGSVRGPNFQVLVQVNGGELVETEPGPVSTYIGYVEDEPDTLVSASLLPAGLRAVALPEDKPAWSIEPMRVIEPLAARSEHVIYSHLDMEPTGPSEDEAESEGETPAIDSVAQQASSGGVAIAAGPAYAPYGCDVMRVELGVDAEYLYYSRYCDANVDTAMANIESTVNALNVAMVRDRLIEHKLGKVVIRTDRRTCPYPDDFGTHELLPLLREQWNTGQYGTTHSVAILIPGTTSAGLAYVARIDMRSAGAPAVWRGSSTSPGMSWGTVGVPVTSMPAARRDLP